MPVSSELMISVERGPVTVVRVAGALSLGNAHLLRRTVMKELAEDPIGVVLDLGGLQDHDELGLIMISTIAKRAARERGLRVALTATRPAVQSRLRALGSTNVESFPGVEEAQAALKHDPYPRLFAARLPFTHPAARQARIVVEHACDIWGQHHVSDAAQIVVNELVSNAVHHARPPIDLSISIRRYIHIEVADGTRDLPALLGPASIGGDRYRGFGMMLVDGLSAAWGQRMTSSGKIVWATLRHDRNAAARRPA
jgi:anti-anti-sigma factor